MFQVHNINMLILSLSKYVLCTIYVRWYLSIVGNLIFSDVRQAYSSIASHIIEIPRMFFQDTRTQALLDTYIMYLCINILSIEELVTF